MYNNSLYGNFRTRTFSEIIESKEDFIDIVNTFFPNVMLDEDLNTLYYLLLADYANSHIASSDENRFKLKMASIIYKQGPIWAKQRHILDTLLELSEDDIMKRGQSIQNHAYNPGEQNVASTSEDILNYLNDQAVHTEKMNKAEALTMYTTMLADTTSSFIEMFKSLFLTIVNPELPLWYIEETE